MGLFKMDPPPETDDAAVLRAYVNDLYNTLLNVLSNIDEENLNDDFINRLNGGG